MDVGLPVWQDCDALRQIINIVYLGQLYVATIKKLWRIYLIIMKILTSTLPLYAYMDTVSEQLKSDRY